MKVAQLCPILCNPVNYTVHGILQARMLEWVAFPFPRDGTQVFHTAGRFFTNWATREAQKEVEMSLNEKTDCSFWVRKAHIKFMNFTLNIFIELLITIECC